MEGRYDKTHTGNIQTLGRVEEIMHQKGTELEVSPLGLQSKSNKKSVIRSGYEDSGTENNGYLSNSHSRLADRFCNDFTQEHVALKAKKGSRKGAKEVRFSNDEELVTKVSTEIKGYLDNQHSLYDISKGTSGVTEFESNSNGSSSKCRVGELGSKGGGDSHKGKVALVSDEVEQLLTRLQILEEDNRIIKKAFFTSAKERSDLLNEVSPTLQMLDEHLRNQVTRKESLAIFKKARKGESSSNGLSQVLQPESKQSLVTRASKVNISAVCDSCRL